MEDDLAHRLLAPIGVERFVDEHWLPHEPCFLQGPPERLAELVERPELSSVDAYLASNPPRCKAWLKKGTVHYAVKDLTAVQARKLWDTGDFTIVGDDVHRHVPIIGRLLGEIRSALGYSSAGCGLHANLYGSRPGGGSRAHFDKQEVIIFQLRGRKEWRHAPNRHIAYPLDSYFGWKSPLLEQQVGAMELPDEIADDANSVTLTPGSVLFLPRGTWHQTLTGDEESLAVTLTFTTRTWLDVLQSVLSSELVGDARFREPVPPITGAHSAAELHAKFARILGDALSRIRDDAEQILALHQWILARAA